METDLNKARSILETGDYTCVICRGENTYTATERGVKPLLNWLDNGLDLTDYSAADRVVGRATAFLYCLLGVKEVYARVMSHPAADVPRSHGILCSADTIVDGIINRKGTGPCPFEAAVMDITDASAALNAIRNKMMQMQKGNG
jgi:hypothetical protein